MFCLFTSSCLLNSPIYSILFIFTFFIISLSSSFLPADTGRVGSWDLWLIESWYYGLDLVDGKDVLRVLPPRSVSSFCFIFSIFSWLSMSILAFWVFIWLRAWSIFAWTNFIFSWKLAKSFFISSYCYCCLSHVAAAAAAKAMKKTRARERRKKEGRGKQGHASEARKG